MAKVNKRIFGFKTKYVSFLKENYQKATVLRPGQFYSYVYKINLQEDFSKIKAYDLMPLVFIFSIDYEKQLFKGVNLHHLPVRSRKIWIARLKNIVNESWKNNDTLCRMAEYEKLYLMFKKAAKFATRQYTMRSMREIRDIPNADIEYLVNFFAKTYYAVNISDVEKRYSKFIP